MSGPSQALPRRAESRSRYRETALWSPERNGGALWRNGVSGLLFLAPILCVIKKSRLEEKHRARCD